MAWVKVVGLVQVAVCWGQGGRQGGRQAVAVVVVTMMEAGRCVSETRNQSNAVEISAQISSVLVRNLSLRVVHATWHRSV